MSENKNANAQANTSTQAPQEERKKFKISVLQNEDFNATMESIYMTTVDIGNMINNLFSPLFADYEGCIVLPASAYDPNQAMVATFDNNKPRAIFNYTNVTLFFRDSGQTAGPGMIKNLQPYGTEANQKNSAVNNGKVVYKNASDGNLVDLVCSPSSPMVNRRHIHELTTETKEALSDFISVNTDKNFWTNNVAELSDNSSYGNLNYTIHISVPGLDLNKLLKTIYGGRRVDEDGSIHYIDYMVNMIKPTSNPMQPQQAYNPYGFPMQVSQMMAPTYLCIVNRLDNKNLDELCTKMGIYNYTSTINMVRA